jgi:hypothetical protein
VVTAGGWEQSQPPNSFLRLPLAVLSRPLAAGAERARSFAGELVRKPVQAVGDLIEGRETGRARRPVAEKMLVAIQKFQQRPLDVMIPLVPRLEGEVLKAPLRFLLRHLSGDHSAENIESEVLSAPFCGKINRSVDKRDARIFAEPPQRIRADASFADPRLSVLMSGDG